LAIAERMLSELKQDIEKLPQAFKDTLAVHADSASPRSSP
jgi:hypothetical protein